MEIQVVRVVGNGPEVFYAAIGSDAHQDDAVLGVPGYAVCVIVKHSISGGIDLIIHIHDTVVIIEWEYCKATRSVVWVEIPHFVVCAIDLVEPVVAGERFALCGTQGAASVVDDSFVSHAGLSSSWKLYRASQQVHR